MGKHTGIVIRDLWEETGAKAGKRWLFRAWDPVERTYASRRFDEKRDGRQWALGKGARLKTGLDVTGKLATRGMADEYLAELRREGRVQRHIQDVDRILTSAIRAGIIDLRSPRLADQAREWLTDLKTSHPLYEARQLSASSLNRYQTVLRALVRFAVRNSRLPRDPLIALKRKKVDRPLKATFTIAELTKLLRAFADPYHLRFALLVYTGCRIGEAMHLRWEHINWEERRITVRLNNAYSLKQRKERTVPLQHELAAILGDIRKTEGWIVEDADQRERPVTYGWHFEKFVERHGITIGDRSPHSTRHTWISLMLATGENTPLIKAYAGHESLVTTEGYAQSQDRYRDAVANWRRGEFEFISGMTSPRPSPV